MRREDVSDWLERYVAAWKSGERGEIEALFGNDARYRYHSYDEPLVGRAAIADSWLDDPDEPGTFDASYECFAADGDAAGAERARTSQQTERSTACTTTSSCCASRPGAAAPTSPSGTRSVRNRESRARSVLSR